LPIIGISTRVYDSYGTNNRQYGGMIQRGSQIVNKPKGWAVRGRGEGMLEKRRPKPTVLR
jgi:hypothetical protein